MYFERKTVKNYWKEIENMEEKLIKNRERKMRDMEMSEKELKLLLNFIKDNLIEAKESDDIGMKNKKIERILEHMQQYLEN